MLLRRGGWRCTAAQRNQLAQLSNGEEADLLALYIDGQHPNGGSEGYCWEQGMSRACAVAIRARMCEGVSCPPVTCQWHAVEAAAAIRSPLPAYYGSLETPRAARADQPNSDSNRANARAP